MAREYRSTEIVGEKEPDPEPVVVLSGKERHCLMCQTKFMSQWPGERVCQRCKSRGTWREGNRWPSGIA